MAVGDDIIRREFLAPAAAGLGLTLIPRHVLGGSGYTAPSDKITLAYIGCGTEGIREMLRLIANPDVQITAVCDPVKDGTNYIDWDKTGIRDSVRGLLEAPNWGAGVTGIRAGRDMAKEIIETYYAKKRATEGFKAVASYADFRELLDKEKDLDSVKIMTPDHLHGIISIAAMKKGKHVMLHKPIANRLKEARLVIDTARTHGVATYFLPWGANGSMDQVMAWIKEGAIGTLREIHNWTNRPVWPQYATLPTNMPPVPKGFDWDLWLGPRTTRPYSPMYSPVTWRDFWDFGTAPIGDFFCHNFDPACSTRSA